MASKKVVSQAVVTSNASNVEKLTETQVADLVEILKSPMDDTVKIARLNSLNLSYEQAEMLFKLANLGEKTDVAKKGSEQVAETLAQNIVDNLTEPGKYHVVEVVNTLTPEGQASMQRIASKQKIGGLGVPTDGILTAARTPVKNQAKNERQKKLAGKNQPVVDNTVVSNMPGGNSEILNPHPTAQAEKPKKAEKPAPKVFTFEFVEPTIDGKYTLVSLADLIGLDDTPIPNVKVALRQLNKEHVAHLQMGYENDDPIPPIKVAGTSWGYAILGGYHRQAALENAIKEKFTDADGKVPDDQKKMYDEARYQFQVKVEPVNGLNARQAVEYAYSDNLTSGLPIADSNRSRYAIWLIENARIDGLNLPVAKAAAIARVSRIAVYRMLARDEGRNDGTKKMPADIVSTAEDKAELVSYIDEQDSKSKPDKLNAATKRMFNAMLNVYDEVQDMDELIKYFTDVASGLKIDRETFLAAMETVIGALSLVDIPEEVKDEKKATSKK